MQPKHSMFLVWNLDDVNNNCLNAHIIDSQQAVDYLRVRGEKYHKTASVYWHELLKQLTNVSLLPVSCRTETCINSGLLKPGRNNGSLGALFMICCLKHQIYFRVVSGHIISVLANRLSNEYQFGPCRFPANGQYFQPNPLISKYWPIFKHEFVKLIINKSVEDYRRDRDEDSDDSTSEDSIQWPSWRRRLSTDAHSQIASGTQYSRALERIEVYG